MSLHFVHPAYLWGMLAAAGPIVIHLINRRRARTVEFAAIALVLRSERRNARRLRLRRLLLLLLRTLVCLAVPIALARPFLAPKDAVADTGGRGPTANVIVLDTSLSMRLKWEGETLFDRAKRQAKELIAGLSPEDAVAVLPCAARWSGPPPSAGYDFGLAREAVDAAQAGYEATDMNACLAVAARVLGAAPLEGKRIFVVSDMTANGWNFELPPPVVSTEKGELRPQIVLVDAAGGAALANRWIEKLEVEPAFSLGPRAYSFTLLLRSVGSGASRLSAHLKVGEEVVARGFIDLEAGGSARKTFSHRFDEGGEVAGAVEVDADDLPDDDVYPFLAFVRRDVHALVVDGDPSVNRYRDEAFFVEKALSPGGEGTSIRYRIVDVDAFSDLDLAPYDLVLLLNVRAVPERKVSELSRFVRSGGGLFISAGDRIDVDAYNRQLGALLPARLHLAKAADGGATGFARIAWSHPIFSVFQGEGREGFASARFQTYLLTRPPPPDTEILATFEEGAPALLLREVEKGRVALFTSTVDRAWTDFPIRTAFLPVMQQLAGYLARALDERRAQTLLVGQSHRLPVPQGAEEVVVEGPEGIRVEFKGEALSTGELTLSQVDRPGVYRVRVRRGTAWETPPGLSFVVLTDRRESDTTRVNLEELRAYLGGGEGEESTVAAASLSGESSGKRPLWSTVLLIVVTALLLEGWLLYR